MPFVVELYFNPLTEEHIRGAWKAIDEAGISDPMPKGGIVHIYRWVFAITLKQIHSHRNFRFSLQVLPRFHCHFRI